MTFSVAENLWKHIIKFQALAFIQCPECNQLRVDVRCRMTYMITPISPNCFLSSFLARSFLTRMPVVHVYDELDGYAAGETQLTLLGTKFDSISALR